MLGNYGHFISIGKEKVQPFLGLQHKYKTLQEKPKKKFKVVVYCHINGTWRYDNDDLQFLGF